MEIGLEKNYWKLLNKASEMLSSKEGVSILDMLYKHGECTARQIHNSLDSGGEKVKKHMSKLEDFLWISSRKVMTHPLTLEEVYSLTSTGRRYFSAFKAIIDRELDFQKAALGM